MKYCWLTVLLLIGFSTPSLTAQEIEAQTENDDGPKIEWVKNLETAQQLSAKDGRPVIAYFTFDACVWCKRLEKACFFDKDVVRLSRKFHWVYVNRDETPEIPKRLNVSAYPSLLTLGKDEENIYRFKSFQEPPEFIGNLNQALARNELYRKNKEWMIPPERSDRIIDEGIITNSAAPSDSVPGGITTSKNITWVAQGKLFKIETKTGKVLAKYELPKSVGDLCTDGEHLFAMTYGWTAGKPIYLIDPETGKTIREIVTEANKKTKSHGAKGIAYRDGHLYVLSGMVGKVYKLDPANGEIVGEVQLNGKWLSGLDFQETNFVTGSRTHLSKFDAKTGKLVFQVPCNYPVRNVATNGDQILLMEQPLFGFGRHHERIQIWPQETKIYHWKQ